MAAEDDRWQGRGCGERDDQGGEQEQCGSDTSEHSFLALGGRVDEGQGGEYTDVQNVVHDEVRP